MRFSAAAAVAAVAAMSVAVPAAPLLLRLRSPSLLSTSLSAAGRFVDKSSFLGVREQNYAPRSVGTAAGATPSPSARRGCPNSNISSNVNSEADHGFGFLRL
jgi:hypothetical protein